MISLPNTSVNRRIEDVSDNVKISANEKNGKKNRNQYYSLQLDESTDASKSFDLFVLICYGFGDTIRKGFLFCQPLSPHKLTDSIF